MFLQYAPRLLLTELARRPSGENVFSHPLEGIVLFVDIVGSTLLTDEFARRGGDGAERLAEILNRYFGRVIEIAAGFGGDTIRIDGDAAVILWHQDGADSQAKRLALGAAAAALALQLEFRDWEPAAGVSLQHRITLVAGTITFIVFSESGSQGFFVIDGVPIRRMGAPGLRGDPGQIVIGDEVAGVLRDSARLAPAACGATELLALNPADRPEPVDVQARPDVLHDLSLESRVRSFVPRVIVDRSAGGHADWIAEFRKLTAVYVNLVGIDPTAPDVAMRVQQAVHEIEEIVNPLRIPITNILASEKGFIVQIACGLPPFAQEHNAVLAVQAALRIHAELATLGIRAAIGITTGDAFCADIGSDSRREYVSTGLVMAYAARLMQSAVNEILCDEITARAASGDAEFSDAEQLTLKGRASPLPVHRARELARARPRFGDHIDATFGRDAELQVFADRLSGLADGRGGVAVVEAEPGAGKTHLLGHLVGTARRSGYAVVTTATSPIEQTTAYFIFRDLLPQLMRSEGDPPELPVATLRGRLIDLLHGHPLAPRLALLEDILPLDLADKGLASEIKGPARLAGIEDLLAHIAGERAAHAPMIVVIDDLQWIDGSSAHLLATLLRRVPRVLAIAAMRPVDEDTRAHVKGFLAVASPIVNLPRLSRDAIHAIVRERLGVPDVPPALVDFIQTHSEGLPFFAEQLLFALRDHGVLAIEGRTCRMDVSGLSKVGAPDSLRDLIVSRVDRLLPGPQLTIKVASAVGRVFDAETVRRVHPLTSDAAPLEETLEQLIDAGLLSRSGDAEYPTYTFRHGIIQGVTYELLPYAQRRPLHRSIALYLEAKYEGALEPHYATLADHWEQAADADRAIVFRVEAADIAARRYANEDALKHLEHAERLVAEFGARLPKIALARSTRIRADACQELTRFSEANRYYKRLAALEAIPVPETRVLMAIGVASESVLQALRRAGVVRSLSQGAEQERDRLAAHIYMRFAEHAYFTNNTLGLAHGTLASLNHAERAASLPEIVNASGGLALGLTAIGLLKWASYYRDRSINLAIIAGSPSAQGFAELLACVQSFHTGDWDRMGLHGVRGASIWKDLGDRYRHQCCLVLEAYRMIATGHYEEADRALLDFGEQAEEIESVQVRAWALAARALLDLLLGRPPSLAVTRIATATAEGNLNPAECLLCDGIAAAAHLEAEDYRAALAAAESGLSNIAQGSPAMAGALLFSVPSIAEVLLALAEHASEVGRTRDELLTMSRVACRAAQRFAARNQICRPRASLLRGYLAGANGGSNDQQSCYRHALADAQKLGLPLEQAMSHLALAQMAGSSTDREGHRHEAGQILQRLGVVWAPSRRLNIGLGIGRYP